MAECSPATRAARVRFLEDALFMTKPVLRVALVIQNGSLEIISLKGQEWKRGFFGRNWAQVALGKCKSVENLKVRKRTICSVILQNIHQVEESWCSKFGIGSRKLWTSRSQKRSDL